MFTHDRIFADAAWQKANQAYITARVAMVRDALEQQTATGEESSIAQSTTAAILAVNQASKAMPAPSAEQMLASSLNLTLFERSLLLLCVAFELDESIAELCTAFRGGPRLAVPTFALAMVALPEPRWSAITPGGPLRHWRLIEVGTADTLTRAPLKIDEGILHFLTGVCCSDERLAGLIERVEETDQLTPSHRLVVDRIQKQWERAPANPTASIIHVTGDPAACQSVAAAACLNVGWKLRSLRAADLPAAVTDRAELARRWQREAALTSSALLLICALDDTPETSRAAGIWAESIQSPLLVCGPELLAIRARPVTRFHVPHPDPAEQRAQWHLALGPAGAELNGELDAVISQFSLTPKAIRDAADEVIASGDEPGRWGTNIWTACRHATRQRLDGLAQRIDPGSSWQDLVLPAPQLHTLKQIAAHVRHRDRVYHTWGFARASARGLGITALFSGPSGTGKTMAAEILAADLQLDLYRVDLSHVVSKYIGETEKNLRRIFDAAEMGGAVLLCDEADALFGKRSEVKDSHDRYANLEVGYLLQRMETYRGLAILTTNMKQTLDTAFLRRLRFTIAFPFPDPAHRKEIWRQVFPPDTPTDGLDFNKLSRLSVTGGNIRVIAMNAAFLAAEANEPVGMKHLLSAAQTEYAKLEKPLSEAETGGWL